jgi:hypothetical protein
MWRANGRVRLFPLASLSPALCARVQAREHRKAARARAFGALRELAALNRLGADARARARDGLQGAHRSHSLGYGEDLQRRRTPEAGMRAPCRACSASPQLTATV